MLCRDFRERCPLYSLIFSIVVCFVFLFCTCVVLDVVLKRFESSSQQKEQAIIYPFFIPCLEAADILRVRAVIKSLNIPIRSPFESYMISELQKSVRGGGE